MVSAFAPAVVQAMSYPTAGTVLVERVQPPSQQYPMAPAAAVDGAAGPKRVARMRPMAAGTSHPLSEMSSAAISSAIAFGLPVHQHYLHGAAREHTCAVRAVVPVALDEEPAAA